LTSRHQTRPSPAPYTWKFANGNLTDIEAKKRLMLARSGSGLFSTCDTGHSSSAGGMMETFLQPFHA